MAGKILIVEDNDINRIMLSGIVSSEYEVVETMNGRQALDILEKDCSCISLILLDVVMPVMNGYEFLTEMKKNPAYASIPVIVTTEQNSADEELRALSYGATEFVRKPYQPEIILHRIERILKLCEASAMLYQLKYDRLTGFYSAEYFFRTAKEVKEKNPHKSYDIICSNIENFHLFNDRFGTKMGDKLLQKIASIYRKTLPGEDPVFARFYADHFVGLIEHREKYTNVTFQKIGDELRKSFGIPTIIIKWGIYVDNGDDIPIEKMCDNAAMAARSVKGQYGVSFACFDQKVRDNLEREKEIVDEMEQAIEEEQFEVYLQPKIRKGSGKWRDAEALVRWIHPEKGVLSPAVFIPVFEKNRFITQLDCYVWEKTCRLLKRWKDMGFGEIHVSVNVSRLDIYNGSLVKRLDKLVKKYEVKPEQLHLEITETSCTENTGDMIESIEMLRAKGFVIEMDDFGSGYSSLNMLMQVPLDILKLDRELIQNEEQQPGGLRYIIGLAHWLNLKVVAEGVETKEQFEHMLELGCDYIQGYYTARPMPWQEFEENLQSQMEG